MADITAGVLVAYATAAGSTRDIAEVIAQVLRENGATVDVRPVGEVHDLRGYDTLVLGSAIHNQHVLPEAMRLVQHYRTELQEMRVAFFAVGWPGVVVWPAVYRRALREYLAPLSELCEPVDRALFSGRADVAQFDSRMRWLLKLLHIPVGDRRDWSAIRAWASRLPITAAAPDGQPSMRVSR